MTNLGKSDTTGYTIQDEESEGRWIQEGTPIGFFVRDPKVQIWALLDESELPYVQEGMKARIRFVQRSEEVHMATISRIATISSMELSGVDSLQANQLIHQRSRHQDGPNEQSNGRDLSSSHYMVLDLPDSPMNELAYGGNAEIVIATNPISIASHLLRLLR